MNGTALEHRLVRNYLVQLNVAMRRVPAAQYQELRDQIVAHLNDVLPVDADDAQVSEALSRLGTPADVAAEAKADLAPTITEVVAAAARRNWSKVVGARRRTKVIALLVVLVLATGASFVAVFLSTPLIAFEGSSGWWYSQDYTHEIDTSADGLMQTTVPVRSGQRQGFAIGIYNPSNFTETVLGPVVGMNAPFDSPNGGFGPVEMGVSLPNRELVHGGLIRNVAFTLPESIPPHQFRILRITWISAICLQGKGSALFIDTIYVRVRVGWFTRTDAIPLGMAWGLAGPSHSPDLRPGPNFNSCL